MPDKNHLLLLTFSHMGLALEAVNSLSAEMEIIEFGQIHGGQIVLIAKVAAPIHRHLSTDTIDGIYLDVYSPDLLRGYFKQLSPKVEKNLLVLETAKLSHLFEVVNTLLSQTDFQLIEISRGTGSQPRAVALLANGKAEQALLPASTDLSVRLIERPTDTLLKMFNP